MKNLKLLKELRREYRVALAYEVTDPKSRTDLVEIEKQLTLEIDALEKKMKHIEISKIKIAEDVEKNKEIYLEDFDNAEDFYQTYRDSFLKGGDDDFYYARIEEDGEEELYEFITQQFENIKNGDGD